MDKSKILLIGCGKAGNALVDEMLSRDKSYTALFVNSEYSDMENLTNFRENAAFVFSNANGSGKNRLLAQDYLRDQVQVLVDKIINYKLQDTIVIFTSADGGTGSGVTPLLIKYLDHMYKGMELNKKINLVAVMPSLDRPDKLGYENAISFWNDIMEVKNLLTDIKLIDNTKGSNYSEINEKATRVINKGFDLCGTDEVGEIDYNDSKRFHSAPGYGVILELPSGCKTMERAIEKAKANSVFVIPNDLSCKYIAISLKKDILEEDGVKICEKEYSDVDVVKYMDNENYIYQSVFRTYQEEHNTIALSGGIGRPISIVKKIKEDLYDLNEKVALYESKRVSGNDKIELESEFIEDVPKQTAKKIPNAKDVKNMLNNLQNLF